MEQFINELRRGASVSSAANFIAVSRTTVYEHREQNDEFKAEWEDAIEEGTDLLEDEARRRAAEGWDEPVFYKGEQQGTVRKYSDTLLIVLLKARRPEKYRERMDLTTQGNAITTPTMFIPATDSSVEGLDGDVPSD